MAKEQTGGDDRKWTRRRSEQSDVERNLTEQSIEHKETECLRKMLKLRAAFLSKKNSLFLEIFCSAKSKEREYNDSAGQKTIGEGHYVRGRTESRSTNNAGKSNKHQSRSKSKDGKRVCWICGKEGHFKKQCYKWLERNKGKSHSQDNGESALARDDAQDLLGLVACEVNLMQGRNEKEEWVLDTCCSFHMTPRRDVFIDFKEVSSGKFKMANSTHSDVKGIGSVRFLNPDGTTFVLHDVRFMPEIGRNLISNILFAK
ncbi:unnamed protein product [Microthlaspi erraticum]|uniref:CCHC-type domain-containing protein n=1 Tax=Microthlaspi erraticum TaxID=1685480 RepID=A0A6D2I9K6_9BRAS|nr:unnamed protein product [Microthlaspi erraticum]